MADNRRVYIYGRNFSETVHGIRDNVSYGSFEVHHDDVIKWKHFPR